MPAFTYFPCFLLEDDGPDIRGLFTELIKKIKLNPPKIPIVSTVTGNWLNEHEITDPAYWARNLREDRALL